MLQKLYGTTGINVSAIGFGGMRFADQDNTDQCGLCDEACTQKLPIRTRLAAIRDEVAKARAAAGNRSGS